MLKLTKEQIEENKRAIREKLDRKRNVPIAEKPEKIEEPEPMEIKKDIHVHIDRNDKEIMSGLGKIQEAIENIKETEEIDIKNFSEVVDKLGSLETAISESKVEIDNKDIIKGLLKIEKKIKEPKVSDYNDLLEFIGDELTEIKKGFTFDSIEKILEEIRDKKVDTSGIKIVDDKGKPIDWKSLGKGTIEYRGGNTGMTDVQLTQLLDGLTDIKTELDDVSIAKNKGTMSTNNSSTTPLGIDEVFTGVADDIKDYAAINISIFADQASADCGFSIEWSQDGTNWDEKMSVSIGKEKVESYEFGVRARYFRLVYTNGAVAQTAFRLQVIYHPVRTREGARCLCVDIDSREFAKTVRAVLAAKKPNGIYTNIHSTAGGNLKMAIEESEVDFPIGTGSNGSVTLTSANTAYAIPATASTKNHIIILYNGSDTDMFVGYENSNANGILLATGKTREFDLGADQQVYAYCASAGKVLTYSYKELNN